MGQLDGKVAIITGASSGIGRAAAVLFAQEGARVVLAARRQRELDEVAAEILRAGGAAIPCAGDVRDDAFLDALVSMAAERFGGLDVAFNNAGVLGMMAPAEDLSLADWHETIETNLTAAFLGARRQIPALIARGGSSLIFTSSYVGPAVGLPGMSAYAASKAGLVGLTRALAAELGPRGVRVNALLPGGTDTAMAEAFLDAPETRAWVENLHALKRTARPEEIARAALFLASDASSFMTGAAVFADGGASIMRS